VDDSHKQFEDWLRAGAYDSAWRYCCRLTSSYEDAQDLLQESVGIAFRKHARLRDASRFRSWLLAIVRSRFLMQLRSRRLTVPLEEELLGQVETLSEGAEELLAHMRQLPVAQREVLELFYFEGLSLEELGRVLAVPEIAARHRLHRAREALRRSVQGQPVRNRNTKLRERQNNGS
jgi:RNA polymerase sigma factor (sigma-70 family)